MSIGLKIDLDLVLDVEYKIDDSNDPHRLYPVDIIRAKHRGRDIYPTLHVGHVLTLQRRVYNRLLESGEIEIPASETGLTEIEPCQH